MKTWRLFGVDPIDGDYSIGVIQLQEFFTPMAVYSVINLAVKVHSISGSTLVNSSNARLCTFDECSSHFEIQSLDGKDVYYRLYHP